MHLDLKGAAGNTAKGSELNNHKNRCTVSSLLQNLMLNWKTASSEAPQKSQLESQLVDIFISSLDHGMKIMVYEDFI